MYFETFCFRYGKYEFVLSHTEKSLGCPFHLLPFIILINFEKTNKKYKRHDLIRH